MDGKVLQWNLETHRIERKYEPLSCVITSLAIRPQGDAFAVGTRRTWARPEHTGPNGVHLFAYGESAPASILQTTKGIRNISFDPTGNWLAASEMNDPILLFDWETKELKNTFLGHSKDVLSLDFSSDGKLLLSSGYDGAARVWDTNTSELRNEILGHSGGVQAARFGHDSSFLLTAGEDGLVKMWGTHETAPFVKPLEDFNISSFDFHPDGSTLAIGGGELHGGVVLMDTTRKHPRTEFFFSPHNVVEVAFSSRGDAFGASCSPFGLVDVWEYPNGFAFNRFRLQAPIIYSVSCFPLSEDGFPTVAQGEGGRLTLWSTETWEKIVVSQLFPKEVGFQSIDHDSYRDEFLLIGGSGGEVLFVDAHTLEKKEQLQAHRAAVTDAVVSTDGRFLATSSVDNLVKLWNRDRLELTSSMGAHQDYVDELIFDPEVRRLVTGTTKGGIRVWGVDREGLAREVLNLDTPHTEQITALEFSPDGLILASGSLDDQVLLWRAFDWRDERLSEEDPPKARRSLENYKREYWARFLDSIEEPATGGAKSGDEPLFIGNATVEERIRSQYQIRDETLTAGVANRFFELNLPDLGLENLDFLTDFSRLQSLDLGNNLLEDISVLGNLTRLRKLSLRSNFIESATPLGTLLELVDLNLDENPLRDISTFERLVNLRELSLDNSKLVDLTPLSNLVLLPFLWVEGCYPPGKAARNLRKKYSGS